MRIEFNAGLLNFFSVSVFKEHSFQFEQSIDAVKDGFDNIAKSVCGMNGGVGILQDALDLVRKRIRHDEQQKENVHEARKKCAAFLEEVKRTDREVAQKVRTNTREFCKKYPHLAPQTSSEGKNWLEDAWDWLVDKGKGLIDWGKKKVKDAVNWLKQAGKEFLDRVVNAAAETVAWLVKQGKNIYEGIVTVFDVITQGIVDFVDASIDFWCGVVENLLNGLADFVNGAINLAVSIGETLGKAFVAVKEFVTEHWDDMVDIFCGVVDFVGGILTIAAAIAAAPVTGGVSLLAVVGGGVAIIKGWDSFWSGVFGISDSEPEGPWKYILKPTSTFEGWLNNLAPGWHLGDLAGLAGSIISIAGGAEGSLLKEGKEVFSAMDKIHIAYDSITAVLQYISSWTDTSSDNDVSKVLSGIGGGWNLPDLVKDVKRILKVAK